MELVAHKVWTDGKEVEVGCKITYIDSSGVYMAADDISGKPTVNI